MIREETPKCVRNSREAYMERTATIRRLEQDNERSCMKLEAAEAELQATTEALRQARVTAAKWHDKFIATRRQLGGKL